MSELKVDTVVNLAGTGKPNFQNGFTVNGAATSTLNLNQYTASSSEPSNPDNGALWWDTANEKTFIYAEGEWKETIGIAGSVWYGDRAIFAGGYTTDESNIIDYVGIASASNATDFGDLSSAKDFGGACGDGTYALHGGGYNSGGTYLNNIDKVTVSTTGNSTDFGDLLAATAYITGSFSNGIYGVWGGGYSPSFSNVIQYVTIASAGNAQDHGDLLSTSSTLSGAANKTYGLFAGGWIGDTSNVIQRLTIDTSSNSIDHGDLTTASNYCSGTSDPTRAVFMRSGGYDFVGIDTAANATSFGNLSSERGNKDDSSGGAADGTIGVFGGGNHNSSGTNVIDRITIQSAGNATDHGDLTVSRRTTTGCSGSSS
jgi:hypothetical protein